MSDKATESGELARTLEWRGQALLMILFLGVSAGAAATWAVAHRSTKESLQVSESINSKRDAKSYRPTDSEWASLVVEPVEEHVFNVEQITEGKIQVNEDRSTPIFSPYAGRITRLLVKAGDQIDRGQPLFVVEATDMVQAQNDFISAATTMNKARSALDLARITDKRSHDLYDAKAVPLKDMQQAQAALIAAQNDLRSAETALEAARNRLRILGRSDEEITTFQETGRINPDTPVYAPLGGTIVQRKVGPGQYVSAGASDPVFVVGDLSNVWLTAFVRETDAGEVRVGQPLSFTVLAFPDRVFHSIVDYVATSIDPTSRRLVVRATVDNHERLLKPEMFASVAISTRQNISGPAIPREALIYEGSAVHAWIVRDTRTIELCNVKVGLTDGRLIQVVQGVHAGDQIVARGSLFIDRVAAGN